MWSKRGCWRLLCQTATGRAKEKRSKKEKGGGGEEKKGKTIAEKPYSRPSFYPQSGKLLLAIPGKLLFAT